MAVDIKGQIQEALQQYEELIYCPDARHLSGFIEVGEGDRYEITIDLANYPRHFPNVYEIGERIPPVMRRHKFDKTNRCCLTTAAKAQVLLKTKVRTLCNFIKLVVIPYFENNSYFEVNGHYLQGEYSHGRSGIIEGYLDILEIDNVLLVLNMLTERLKGLRLKRFSPCYCGSGIQLKKCGNHEECYRNFRCIDADLIHHDCENVRIELKRRLLQNILP